MNTSFGRTALGLLLLSALVVGCGQSNRAFLTRDRLDRGLVIILPGIEGESPRNQEIRRGLDQAGLYCAMPIYHWGRPIPIAGLLINQVDVVGNRLAAKELARVIVNYQNSRPGRPVFLVGHSAGGGIAVFTAEALPVGYRLDALVLLSASISAGYDLSKALAKTRRGIVNFFSPADVGMLVVGTTLAGNMDGARGSGAGAYGFDLPGANDSPARLLAYRRLWQFGLEGPTNGGFMKAHASTTRSAFVAKYVAPWICATVWPPRGARTGTCPTLGGAPASAPATSPAGGAENRLPAGLRKP
jgi:pimeloyl-ACP methyl ester carboxylesterase